MNSTEYELFVRDIQQILLKAQALKSIRVDHNIKLKGVSGQEHQIDVYWEYRIAGVTHRVALECKLHKTRVDIGIVRDFWGVLDDVSGLRGVIISPVGFTSGAKTYATSKGIGLKVLREAKDTDYKERLRAIHINLTARLPLNPRLQMNLDESWLASNLTPQRQELIRRIESTSVIETQGVIIEDRDSGETIILSKLLAYLPVLDLENISGTHTWKKTFINGYWVEQSSQLELKLSSVKVDYEVGEATDQIVIDGGDIANTLVQDALEGTLLFVNEKGSVMGDIELEGIHY
ncbi:restriction endonuclease [uncultured Nostoc sp.]|uniref:restriction endonuclease n=1 Tax=uncultured Nostoc sp. TaxID=340711 RepID=UPI00262EBF0C|nr:restriction endonuclease [uncultured Nostoc sp.]